MDDDRRRGKRYSLGVDGARQSTTLREGRPLSAFFGVFRNPDRPVVFDVIFWFIVAVIYAFRVFDPLNLELVGSSLATMTVVCAVLVWVWLVLPWNPSASRRRKLAAPAFLVASTAMLFASDLVWAAGLYPVAFANAVFLFGPPRGAAYSAATLLALFATSFAGSLSDDPVGPSPEAVVQRFAFIVLLTVVCMGLSAAVMEARRSREEASRLLEDLESAHGELRRYAERVRELTLSEERARIAREIHDSVGHHLTAVRLQTEAAVKMAEKRPGQAREQMERARDLASEAFEEVRRSVRALKPPAMGERSGAGALAALVRAFEGTGFDIRFDAEGDDSGLPPEMELILYRAAQESLANAARHSGARRVRVRVSYGDGAVSLAVADDGRGAADGDMAGGFGLSALRERIEAADGSLSAGNAPEGGFAVEVELPLDGSTRAEEAT